MEDKTTPSKLSPISTDPADYPIKPHYTWDVMDSSKLTEGMRCMRRFFFHYVLGWVTEYESHDLVFGQAWHLAMDYLYLHGIHKDNIPGALAALTDYYRETYDEFTDLDYEPKIPAHAEMALHSYVTFRKFDPWRLASTDLIEVSGTVPVSEDWRLVFRLDKVMTNDKGEMMVRDHKTASRNVAVISETWSSKVQPNLYGHALLCLIDEEKFRGVEMDITYFRKKDVDDAGINRHIPIPVYRDKALAQGWLWDLLHWLDQVEWSFNQLKKCSVEDDIMKAFPRNTENGCTSFMRKCPYYDYCIPQNNPLKLIDDNKEDPSPVGLITKRWDPRKIVENPGSVYDLEAKEKVE